MEWCLITHRKKFAFSLIVRVTKSRMIIWTVLVARAVEPENVYSAILVFLEYLRGRDQMGIQA